MLLPKELLHIILEYDGRIKYRNGQYVNIIHKHDERYNIITLIISKKMYIMKNIESYGSGFHFAFCSRFFTLQKLVRDYIRILRVDWYSYSLL